MALVLCFIKNTFSLLGICLNFEFKRFNYKIGGKTRTAKIKLKQLRSRLLLRLSKFDRSVVLNLKPISLFLGYSDPYAPPEPTEETTEEVEGETEAPATYEG